MTTTPLIGLPAESVTGARRGLANGQKPVVVCGVPLTACIPDGVPTEIVKALLCAEARDMAVAVS